MITAEEIIELSKSLYIKITQKELNSLISTLQVYENQMENLKNINVNDVSSMTFPFDSFSEEYQSWNYDNLREDIPDGHKQSTLLAKNCPKFKDNYVIIPRVF